jgi:hypothetical protein
MAHRHIAVASSFFLALCAFATGADAFCRSTTCRGDKCPQDEAGCPSSGAKLQWPTSCISFSFQKAGSNNLDLQQAKDAVTRSFQHWSEVKCSDGTTASLTFTRTDDVVCKKSQYNAKGPNVNVVLFQDNDWTYRGIDGTLAKTSVTYNDDTGEIYDADIEVNSANNPVTIVDPPKVVKYDLEAIMTHEVGHFIGLAHSAEPDAVMYASYAPGSISQRKLTTDDVDAICAVYPATRKAACSADPRGGLGPTCDDPPAAKSGCAAGGAATGFFDAWPAALGAGVLALVFKWRRRARSSS